MRYLTALRIMLVATLVAAGVSLTATAPASAASPNRITVTANKSVVLKGQSATLKAKFYKNNALQRSGSLLLQYKSGSQWKTARKVPITNGVATTTAKPPKNRSYRLATTTKKTVSAVKTVKLQHGFTSKVSSASVNPKTKTTFSTEYFQKGKAATGKVQLQYKAGSRWKTLKTMTLKSGKATFTRVPKSTSTYRWRSVSTGSTTKSFKVTVKPQATIRASSKSISKGSSTKLTVGYTKNGKAVPKASVRLQYHTGSSWKTLRSLTIKNGTATTTIKPSKTTKYRVVAATARTGTYTISVADSSATYWVNSSVGLNARSGPGTNYGSVGKFANGTKLSHNPADVSVAGGYTWRKVTGPLGGKTVTAWVADTYLTTKAPTTPAPPANGVPSSFTVSGSGFGHGIGMSQFGAYQMAREGKTAAQILQHYYSGNTVKNYTSSKQYINVQLLGPGFNNPKYTTRTISFKNGAKGWWTLVDAQGNKLRGFEKVSTTQSVRMQVSGSNVKATLLNSSGSATSTTASSSAVYVRWSGTNRYNPTGGPSVATVQGSITSSRSGNYRHGQLIVTSSSGALNVVNNLKFQTEYMYGIAEMPSGWGYNGGAAALQAQAITARTYAQNRLNSSLNKTCNCHIVDTTQHQFFTGWDKENEGSNGYYGKKWKEAVNATHSSASTGKLLFNGNSLSGSYYYSASGGRTANSEDVWSSKVSYLRSVNDPYSLRAPGNSNVSWTQSVTQSKMKGIFPSLSDVKSVTVSAKYSSGQVKSLTATSSTGAKQTVTYKADVWRTKLGTKASWVSKIAAN
ncbi:SpoIID/LytB domain-containing protein [Jonesia quinghaiensis]|uniref:SpoIID/LytB domain-containing protein n=1 Tax=Jonesia quinghaiensis TaxID=262806 RepID=UPI00048C1EB6|nr:SpoIID/LytB domain-containing protein [Jonesia quinghaiensis]